MVRRIDSYVDEHVRQIWTFKRYVMLRKVVSGGCIGEVLRVHKHSIGSEYGHWSIPTKRGSQSCRRSKHGAPSQWNPILNVPIKTRGEVTCSLRQNKSVEVLVENAN